MAYGPRPPVPGHTGQDDDDHYAVIQTCRGHMEVNLMTDGDRAVDQTFRRHAVTPAEGDFSGDFVR